MKERTALLLLAVTLCQGAITTQKECSTNELIAHENCNQYYQCVHGVLMARDCNPHLYFNPDTQACDYPSNVDCTNNEDEKDDPVSRCSSGKAEGQFLAHENCNQYYRCVHGNLLQYTCDLGLLFDPESLSCNWARYVTCKEVTELPNFTETPDNTQTPTSKTEGPDVEITSSPDCDGNCEDSHSDESESEQDISEDSSSEVTSDEDSSSEDASDETDSDVDGNADSGSDENSTEDDDGKDDNKYDDNAYKICARDDSDGVLIPHRDCRKFYICSGGKPVIMECPGDLLFNPDTENCDYASNVNCDPNGAKLVKKELGINVDVAVRGKTHA